MKIEVLYFDGRPNDRLALELVRSVLEEENVRVEVVEVNVCDDAAARAVGFPGSPTVRVDGSDVERSTRTSGEYGMMCRKYLNGHKREGSPSKELIRPAVREALAGASASRECRQAPRGAVAGAPRGSARPAMFMASSVVAAALASFCCILPIVFALTGLTVLGAAAMFAAWRPYLLGATFGLLGLGFYFAYRTPKERCAPGSVCAVPASRRRVRRTLWVAAVLALALAAFPYFSKPVADWLLSAGTPAPASPTPAATALATANIMIEGMDCAACATTVENKLAAIPGVRQAAVSFERGMAEVRYDPALASLDQFEKAAQEAGYRVRNKAQR